MHQKTDIITVGHLSHAFAGKTVLQDINLSIKKRRICDHTWSFRMWKNNLIAVNRRFFDCKGR